MNKWKKILTTVLAVSMLASVAAIPESAAVIENRSKPCAHHLTPTAVKAMWTVWYLRATEKQATHGVWLLSEIMSISAPIRIWAVW